MRLSKDQEDIRDKDLDWEIAQLVYHAAGQNIWCDYSPTSDWQECGRLIEKYQIDIRYFSKERNSDLEHEWMGGLQYVSKQTNLLTYYTAFAPTPMVAAMSALRNALTSQE
jgi:hypothetical protein